MPFKNLLLAALLLPAAAPAQNQLVGYFPQWGIYNNYFAADFVHSGEAATLTQLDYAQGAVKDNRCAVADPNADLTFIHTAAQSINGVADNPSAPLRGNFHQLQLLRVKYPRMKIVLSLEGKASSFADIAKPDVRADFVKSCIDTFILGHLAPGVEAPHLFDGFDVDWEYPNKDQNEDFIALLAEFRRQLNAVRPGMQLTIATGAAREHLNVIDWRRVAPLVDSIGVMTYDFNGPWTHTTGFVAPLRSGEGEQSVTTSIESYLAAGVPAHKLLLGVPLYAYQWKNVGAANNGLGQNGTPVHGNLDGSTARALLAASPKAKVYRDPASGAPWVYDGTNFLTYEDTTSLRAKAAFARTHHLGGIMVWELSGDGRDATLLRALSEPRGE